MTYVVYLDETGDHSLELIDKDYPVFGLVMVIVDIEEYVRKIVPSVYQLKFDFFGHEGVLLHSYDIRRQRGAFAILANAERRRVFIDRINSVMIGADFKLIATFIRKDRHKIRYGERAANPYDLALEFALERLLPLLEGSGQKQVQILAEARGKREDEELRISYNRFVTHGNKYIWPDRVRAIDFMLTFKSKETNLIGMQIADLVAYPIAHHVIDKNRPNPAFDLIRGKFYDGPGRIQGLKVFP